MNRSKWILTGKFAAVMSVPLLLWAYPDGAPSRHTGGPGDVANACLACHAGTLVRDSTLVDILSENGVNYQPGVKQRITIRTTDANARRYGFEASARLESNLINGQAGTFTPADNTTHVVCEDDLPRGAIGCAPTLGKQVEFITHSQSQSTREWVFDWTPPQSATAGPVVIYVAVNAVISTGTGASRVHLKSLRLQPGAGGAGARPVISNGGVVQVSNFGAAPRISPGTYMEIFGRDLSLSTRAWTSSDFNNGVGPTNLDNVQVTVDGKAAFVNYVSPTQVNVVVPDGIAEAPVQVIVRNAGGVSDPVTITGARRTPGILAIPSFNVNGRQYVVAQFADQTFAGLPNLISGVAFRTPRPGDRLVIYGVGFGPTTPAIAAGATANVATDLGSGLRVQVGSATAAVEYKGLAPGFVGLYQFNIVVPNVQTGDQEIYMEIDGVRTQSGVYLTTAN